ncbi:MULTISPECIES: hypothetical protein [Niallia]|uniref:Uncharacterized protein n=3 Tax=Bacteria TaxID=2 RepID=A0A3S2W2I9_9BACI|nr:MULTISPECIES: hypothetical protein [Niallia]MDK8642435.1 hypothetical protein [Niallia taxi]MED4040587.1 hypothetical protein [Niallia taxi]MED4057027.1 hypothetical protein [Niallia taxi]MED4121627.1 hypothetical protein [Niallia taxi]RVT59538.1 hypothetical protein EM808_19795 [Niallia taxi]
MRISEVFTAGGVPSITYNSRESLELEYNLALDLEIKGKIISISGPTKIGKTTLCKKTISNDDFILISGGAIKTSEVLWSTIINKLAVANSYNRDKGKEAEQKETSTIKVVGEAGIWGWFKARLEGTDSKSESEKITGKESETFTPNPLHLAIESLLETNKVLIIDDFHYCTPEIQTEIIRALKEPIASGLRVILCSVPHRGVDSIKVEKEMDGRVIQLGIEPWEREELYEISKKGFEALDIECPDSIFQNFISESYKSPHLMQDFCYWFCRLNKVVEKMPQKQYLPENINYEKFYQRIVKDHSSKELYDKLVAGPSRDRKQREFKNGSEGDIYYAVMIALSDLTHETVITVDTVREKLKELLTSESMPNKTQVSQVLKKMAELAKDHTNREPAIDFQNDRIYIVDPFFSFYLKWIEK